MRKRSKHKKCQKIAVQCILDQKARITLLVLKNDLLSVVLYFYFYLSVLSIPFGFSFSNGFNNKKQTIGAGIAAGLGFIGCFISCCFYLRASYIRFNKEEAAINQQKQYPRNQSAGHVIAVTEKSPLVSTETNTFSP